MNKVITYVSINEESNDVIVKELSKIFQDIAEIRGYYYTEDSNKKIISDLVLCSWDELVPKIKKRVHDDVPIIVTKKSIRSDKLMKLFSLKENTNVLVVSNIFSGAEETINILLSNGLSHLEFVPYAEGMDTGSYRIAISHSDDIPVKLKNKSINIGEKYVDLNTLLDVAIKLKFNPDEIKNMILNFNFIINKGEDIHNNINKYLKNSYDIVNDGVVFTNSLDEIIFCNAGFLKIIKKDEREILGNSINDIIVDHLFKNFLYDASSTEITAMINNSKLLVTKKYINENNNKIGCVFRFQNITNIYKNESKNMKELISKGFYAKYTFDNIIGCSHRIEEAKEKAKKFASTDYAVLIQGESGTGKEMFAHAIHNESNRKDGPFVAVNIASLSDELAVSELMGYSEGSFTGALKTGKKGLFEIANNGTIFLDEIGDISPILQQKLLRVLQEHEIMPIGGNKTVKIDVRIIVATNKNLKNLVVEGKFRDDLYYRLDVLKLSLPSLNERKEDIKSLAKALFSKLNSSKQFSDEAIKFLQSYEWLGNIREFENIVRYVDCTSKSNIIEVDDFKDKLLESNNIEATILSNNVESGKSFNTRNTDGISEDCMKVLLYMAGMPDDAIMGRHSMVEKLDISDFKLKKIFNTLQNKGFISVGKTKQGSKLTENGIAYLKKLRFI